jgi:hypothetical protein
MNLALMVRLWTGQREGDVPRLKWSDNDGQVIWLKQRQGQRRGKKKNASAIGAIAFLKFGNADNSISTGIPVGGGRTTPGLRSSVVASRFNYVCPPALQMPLRDLEERTRSG